jgi:predicted CxxxxCH...CXXCH cytochrome family protein
LRYANLLLLSVLFLASACQESATAADAGPDLDPDIPTPGESFGESCYRCHGNSLSPAPPRGIGGSSATTDNGVGAHRSHLAVTKASTWHAPVLCASCHLVPEEDNSPGHIDDDDNRAEITFSALASTGDLTPTRNEDGTCSNVYCHGATLGGGTLKEPNWTLVDGSQRECGTCHGAPPPAPHPVGDNCGGCHPTVSAADNRVFLDPSRHINGIVEVSDGSGGACDSCHGSDGESAPPRDIAGNTDRASIGVGAHREHLALSAWRREINCSNCHVVPTEFGDPGHVDGDNVAEVPFDALNPTATVDLAAGTCSNLYCHGTGRGNNGSASWTDTTVLDCKSCHQSPNVGQNANGMSGEHDKHIRDKRVDCVECHAEVVDGNRNIIAGPLHIDGQRSILMPKGGDWNPSNRRCSNMACHENETW